MFGPATADNFPPTHLDVPANDQAITTVKTVIGLPPHLDRADANTNVKSDRGQGLTALDYARTRGYQDIVALLTADAGGNEASKYCEYASDCFGSCRCS